MSAEFPQPQPPAPQGPYMQPGAGYYPAQGQPQYGPPVPQGPALTNFPGQVLGLVMLIVGGVLALLGLILTLAADMDSYGSGMKTLWLGVAFLVAGLVMVGQWLATAIILKSRS